MIRSQARRQNFQRKAWCFTLRSTTIHEDNPPMKRIALAAAVAAITINGCGAPSHAQQVKTCETYLSARFRQIMRDPRAPAITHRPPQCDGLSNAELDRIAGRILGRYLG